MKKIIVIVTLVMLSIAGFSQSFKGFWKPVDKNLLSPKLGETPSPTWLFRPTVELSALQLTWNKTTKGFDASSLTSAGVGISYEHFILDDNGEVYNNFGLTGLLLFDLIPTETTPAGLSLAATVNALKFINVGGGYSFGGKRFFILTGVIFNFNK
jgi:hypothetical protein